MRIEHKFTTLNQFINATRTNRYVSAKIKREETEIARLSLLGSPPLNTPCKLRFIWSCANKRNDLDGLAFDKELTVYYWGKDKIVRLEIVEKIQLKKEIDHNIESICEIDFIIKDGKNDIKFYITEYNNKKSKTGYILGELEGGTQ